MQNTKDRNKKHRLKFKLQQGLHHMFHTIDISVRFRDQLFEDESLLNTIAVASSVPISEKVARAV